MTQSTYDERSPLLPRSPSAVESAKATAEAEIPNGDTWAWLQVLAGHLVVFNVWGYITSYGFFQEYYVKNLQISPADASWIGAVQMFMVHLLGSFSGRAMDAGYLRTCIATGCLLQALGAFATSFGTELWHFWLAQGICSGIGHGLVFSPMISLYSTWFTTKRVMAVSLASCGAATGGMVFPTIGYYLFDRLGFAWTVRLMALIIAVNGLVVSAVTRARIVSRKSSPWFDFTAFKELSYTMFSIGSFFIFEGIYFAYIYVRQFAQSKTNFSFQESLFLLFLMNGVGLPSRVLVAYLADRYLGAVRTCILVSIPCGAMLLCWIAVDSHQSMVIWATVYGIFANCALSQVPASNAYFGAKNPEKSGTRVGTITTINSIPLLTGPYIAGKLIALNGGDYLYAQIFGGLCIIIGALFLVGAQWADTRKLN